MVTLKKHIVFKTIILFSISCFAQQQEFKYRELFFNLHGSYGFVTPHHYSIKYFVEDHTPGFQFETGFKTYGHKAWHQYHNFPDVGFGFYHSGLGNDMVYGRANALYSFIQTNINRKPGNVQLKQKFSFGLSYLSETYDLRENPYNLAIGSHLNVYLSYMLGLHVNLNDNLSAYSGFNFTHVSNGKVKEPNKGLNTVTGSLGLSYRFKQENTGDDSVPVSSHSYEPRRWSVFYSVGWKQISRRVDGYFFTSSLAFDYAFYVRSRAKAGVGIDFFYDSSVDEHQEFDYKEFNDKSEYFKSAIHLSYEFIVGRTSFIIQPGVYFFNPYDKFGYGVNRLGIRYRLTPWLSTNVAIKAHLFAKADFIEWGLGYTF